MDRIFASKSNNLSMTQWAIDFQADRLYPSSTLSNSSNSSQSDPGTMDGVQDFFLITLLTLCSGATMFGNVLVIYAIGKKSYLHTPTNTMIASLAIADFLVGSMVMPFNTILYYTKGVWLFGLPFCDVFHSMDILASTASIWNLCLISIDRFLGVRDPFSYNFLVTIPKAMIALVIMWTGSLMISFPAILWWRRTSPHLYQDEFRCIFVDDKAYLYFSSIVSFYLPLCILLVAYGNVYYIAFKFNQSLVDGQRRHKVSVGTGGRGSGGGSMHIRVHKKSLARETSQSAAGSRRRSSSSRTQRTTSKSSAKSSAPAQESSSTTAFIQTSEEDTPRTPTPIYPSTPSPSNWRRHHTLSSHQEEQEMLASVPDLLLGTVSISSPSLRNFFHRRHHSRGDQLLRQHQHSLQMERVVAAEDKAVLRQIKKNISSKVNRLYEQHKAAKTLGIVVGCFILCWLPFFVVNLIAGSCAGCLADKPYIMPMVTWLGHLNSCLNPIIYPFFNDQFRRAFRAILCGNNRGKRSYRFGANSDNTGTYAGNANRSCHRFSDSIDNRHEGISAASRDSKHQARRKQTT